MNTVQALILAVCTWCSTATPAVASTHSECYASKHEFRTEHPTAHMYYTDRAGPNRCYHTGGSSVISKASKPSQPKVGDLFSKQKEKRWKEAKPIEIQPSPYELYLVKRLLFGGGG